MILAAGAERSRFAAIRGGNWNDGTRAGVFSLNLNNGPSNWNSNVGFRCVLPAAGVDGATAAHLTMHPLDRV